MVGQRYTGASTANKSVDPPQHQIGKKQKHPIEGRRKEGFAKAGGHRTLFVFIIVAFINTGMLMSFGFPAGISKCEPLAIVAPDESINTRAADAENDMTALDRRMLKYFQSYFYVPPVPNKAKRNTCLMMFFLIQKVINIIYNCPKMVRPLPIPS